ncbi:MAG: metallophosphoesterase [Flavobacteriales bacterium]|jgi:predicted MPP superfamily phosphohydrolase|nr:metallophosphoesterase [Flavobacteriales bacterium]
MVFRWILVIAITALIQVYAFQAVKTFTSNRIVHILYWIVVVFILALFYIQSFYYVSSRGFSHFMSYSLGLFFSLFLFQSFLILFLFLEDSIRLPQALYRYMTTQQTEGMLPERRKFISQIALGLAAIPFTALLIGMVRGKYNYKVLKYTLTFDDLPDAFDGLTLAQISDIHSGSFDNPEKVAYGVDLVNQQNPDLILFTGDIVNNKTTELYPYQSIFSKLSAPMGVYSILGNHDYGDYVDWESEAAKRQNMEDLKRVQKEMGFHLLLNESVSLEKEGEKISLVGVENWGKGRFKKAGDLEKAVADVAPEDFKILLSHDPSHWEAQVLSHPFPFHLTLSGHTHGMQFGIDIPGVIKWSPAKWRYKQWAGIYNQGQQYLNVNRGFGYLAYPGRVGIWPEISLITLKKKPVAI